MKNFFKRGVYRIVRRLSRFAWAEMLYDVGRAEWKFGRTNVGLPKDWTEWNNIREHLKEAESLRGGEDF